MRLSKSLCAAVGEALTGSHDSLNALFVSAGAPGEPPASAHHSKWKEWLFRAGQDPKVDSLAVLGYVLEEFMDMTPKAGTPEFDSWKEKRARVEAALEENGLRYYRFGRVLPQGNGPYLVASAAKQPPPSLPKPATVDEVIEVVVCGLRRAMHPLTHRRKGSQALSFGSEYDVQDLLHALLRPWVRDIRPEESHPVMLGRALGWTFSSQRMVL